MNNCTPQTDDCRCQNAVMRSYKEMMATGCGEDEAYETAFRVFRYYHPEHAHHKADQIVSGWLKAA